MDPATALIIGEIAKFGMTALLSYMKQAGLTADQIEAVYQEAKKGMLARDPADIPSA